MKIHMTSLITLAASAVVATTVQASPISSLEIATSTGFSESQNITGLDVGNGNYYYGNQTTDDSFTVTTNMVGDSGTPRLGGNIQVSNASTSEIDFVIGFYLPVNEQNAGEFDWSGSMTLALTGIDASISSLVDNPVWTAELNNIEMGTMLVDPFEIGFSGTGTEAVDDAISGSIDWNGDSGTLFVELAFSLSQGDTAVFGTSLGFVPAPGAISLLAMALVFGRSRRRSACSA